MVQAPLDGTEEMEASLADIHVRLQDVAKRFSTVAPFLSNRELMATLAAVEDIAAVLAFMQASGAYAVEQADVAAFGGQGSSAVQAGLPNAMTWADPAASFRSGPGAEPTGGASGSRKRRKTEFANNAEFLRARLAIGIVEARRRIRIGKAIAAPVRLDGETGRPLLPALAEAMASGDISGPAAAIVTDSIARASYVAGRDTLEAMESALVRQAAESDADTLAMVAKTWETAVDQDGAEPSAEELKARQGVFYRGRRRGLHQFVINTTDEQYEAVATAMNTATNPRIRSEAIGTAAESGIKARGARAGGTVAPARPVRKTRLRRRIALQALLMMPPSATPHCRRPSWPEWTTQSSAKVAGWARRRLQDSPEYRPAPGFGWTEGTSDSDDRL